MPFKFRNAMKLPLSGLTSQDQKFFLNQYRISNLKNAMNYNNKRKNLLKTLSKNHSNLIWQGDNISVKDIKTFGYRPRGVHDSIAMHVMETCGKMGNYISFSEKKEVALNFITSFPGTLSVSIIPRIFVHVPDLIPFFNQSHLYSASDYASSEFEIASVDSRLNDVLCMKQFNCLSELKKVNHNIHYNLNKSFQPRAWAIEIASAVPEEALNIERALIGENSTKRFFTYAEARELVELCDKEFSHLNKNAHPLKNGYNPYIFKYIDRHLTHPKAISKAATEYYHDAVKKNGYDRMKIAR